MQPSAHRIAAPLIRSPERLCDLSGVSATMLITLAAKMLAATDAPDLGYADRRSARILRTLDIDPRRFNLNPYEVRAVVLRSQWFMQTVRRFLERHPDGLCINLGCGLDPSFEELEAAGDGRFSWFDVDLPDVIAIRRRFFADTPRRRIIAGDITDPRFFAAMPWDRARPAIVVAEGILYFLRRAQVESIFHALAAAADARAANLEIAFDYASPFGAWIVTRRPAHRQLGTTFPWTLHNLGELRGLDPRLEVAEDSNVFRRAMGPGARQVDTLYRMVTGNSLGGCARLSRTAAA